MKDHSKAYDKFFEFWGEEAQLQMCIEEMSELTKELCKFVRYSHKEKTPENEKFLHEIRKNIIEETADVLNCATQMRQLFGAEEIDKIIDFKVERTLQRLEKEKKQKNS